MTATQLRGCNVTLEVETLAILRIEGLTKVYRRGFFGRPFKALDTLDLEVEEGQIFGFLGPNGAGKTTTMKLLLGLIFPTSGNGWLLGEPIGRRTVSQRIGYMPENPSFYRFLSGLEFLKFCGKLCLLNRKTSNSRANELIELVGLGHAKNARIGEYSRGMLQRVGLAQSLMSDPQLLLLDEPLSGLDPIGRKEISDVILQLGQKGKTIFFSSHILSDVETLCDRIAILNKGILRSVGKVSELVGAKIRSIVMEVEGIPEDKVKEIEPLATRVQDMGASHFRLEVANQDSVNRVISIATSAQAKVISIVPQKESLEDYFLREIKEGN